MTREVEIAPSPAGTLAALTGAGYTVQSAVADLIDNAISAGAREISLSLDLGGGGTLTLQDDGHGMDGEVLVQAMKIGYMHGEVRNASDLGRFGTGLKAASLYLSQSGQFTLSSARAGGRGTVATLDTERMAQTGRWLIDVQDEVDLLVGTTVRIAAPLLALRPELASAEMRKLSEHLRCTFATYLADGLSICVQGTLLRPWSLCSPELPEVSSLSSVRLDDKRVRITPFILPTYTDDPEVEGPLGRHEHAGFHVHRAGRALTLGGWLGLGIGRRHRAASDRVRVLVDIGPELDRDWRVNLSKSGCAIPPRLKPRLRDILDDVMDRAGRQRGPRERSGDTPTNTGDLWNGKAIRRDHPLVQDVMGNSRAPGGVEHLLIRLEEERHHG
ncbi:ATP-binding protein [Deinococcus aerophilus]|uniref:ATPase n=1 Tax=Deinococcus aerophilus TaxID=522488 RepID=A0ABQ2GMT1_9DEIO|nr:ATP-binding protein [Deinococcus aerophilus]GGM02553.1 ATPase [Deinococcus aerophilus]